MTDKIVFSTDLTKRLDQYRKEEHKIVFTNGCFDLLHLGHIEYLSAAKALGHILIIGINDDASVRLLKGATRPINNLEDRMQMLAALESTDIIIPFSERTPAELIRTVRPNVLVKGGDYTVETIVGAEQVMKNGGEVKVIPFKAGYSSTTLIEKIKNL